MDFFYRYITILAFLLLLTKNKNHDARLQEGVLRLILPKAEKVLPRKITINAKENNESTQRYGQEAKIFFCPFHVNCFQPVPEV